MRSRYQYRTIVDGTPVLFTGDGGLAVRKADDAFLVASSSVVIDAEGNVIYDASEDCTVDVGQQAIRVRPRSA